MSQCIVGYSGFVGGNLLLKLKFDYLFNSTNFIDAVNLNVDTLYFCGIPANKWYANKFPDEDFKNMENVQNILKTMTIRRIILISTIDVYQDLSGNFNEDSMILNSGNNHAYGKHRYLFEEFIKKNFANHYIVRLPGLFGYGLKKNVIFDLINNNKINNICMHSTFQWYSLNWLTNDIEKILDNNIRICNLFTEPLPTMGIICYFNYPHKLFSENQKTEYNLKTKYSEKFNCDKDGYVRTKEEVEDELIKFINFNNIKKEKLCVSNICTNKMSQLQFSRILNVLGLRNVEIAPTKLVSWDELNLLDLNIFKKNGIQVYSFQSITFNLTDFNIFNDNSELLLSHLKNVIDSAYLNNVKILVFGCPGNRKIIDYEKDNKSIAIIFFKSLGDYCKNKNITLCIEPNSKKYGCNFINTIDEAAELISEIGSSHIKLMVDLGNIIMEDDDISKVILLKDEIGHVQISQEFLDNFKHPHSTNSIFSYYLNNVLFYDGMISLEMLNKTENEIETLFVSILNFINLYGTQRNKELISSNLHFKKLYM